MSKPERTITTFVPRFNPRPSVNSENNHDHYWQYVRRLDMPGKLLTYAREVPQFEDNMIVGSSTHVYQAHEIVKMAEFICICGETKRVKVKDNVPQVTD